MIEDIIKAVKNENVKIIRFKFVDISGKMYAMSTTQKNLRNVLKNGISFDSSSIPNFSQIFESDMRIFPLRS